MKEEKRTRILAGPIGILLLLTLLPVMIYAGVPQQLNYQGKLTDSSGNPVADGSYLIGFAIYDVASGGTALWSESQTVTVSNGVYNVILGQPGNELDPDDFDGDMYLGVTVESDAEMTPRQKLTSTAFAMKSANADDADTLDGIDSTTLDQSAHVGDTGNPHSVTAAQTGAATLSDISWGNLSGIPGDIADGDQVGITSETDPTVTASVKDGVTWIEISSRPDGLDDGDDVGITMESDPQVGGNSINYVPKWNGSALVSGTIYDNGNVGIGTTSLQNKLEVAGDVKVTGSLNAEGYLRNYQLINLDPLMGLGWEQHIDYGGIAIGSLDGANRQMFMFTDGAGSQNVFTVATSQNTGTTWEADFVVQQDGNVGIGTADPAARLDVVGDINISGNYKYTSEKTFYLNIPACAFQKDEWNTEEVWATSGGYQYLISGTSDVDAYAPVHLPTGAIVKEVMFFYYDDHATANVVFAGAMRRRFITNPTVDTMAFISTVSSGSSSSLVLSMADDSIDYDTIVNPTYSYQVKINWDPQTTGATLRFYGCRIEYTMTAVTP